MDNKLIGEIVLFIIIEIVGLIPVGIHFLVKKTSENEKGDLAVMLTRNVMFRALFIDVISIPIFIFFSDKRIAVTVFLVAAQMINLFFFRKGK